MKRELQVAALENGTVIDHIPCEQVFNVVSLLHLDRTNSRITIGNNLDSRRIEQKGIIKIADKFFKESEINRISLIAPTVRINVIRNYEVVEKRNVALPDSLINTIKCVNPQCITNNEPMNTHFHVIDKRKVVVKCHYCERVLTKDEIEIR